MARRFRHPALPMRPMWYEPPMVRHENQIPRLPWGRVPAFSRRSIQVDYHPGYRGYGGYVSPDVFKRPINMGAVGVGIASAAGAGALALLVQGLTHKKMPAPGWKDTLPVALPALGAGFLCYLLRWKLDQTPPGCPECPPCICRAPNGDVVTGEAGMRQGLI